MHVWNQVLCARNKYLVEISNFMNGGDFLDFNSITLTDRTCLPCGKPQCFKKFLKNKCEMGINLISAMREYIYLLNAEDAFFEKNAYSEPVSSGFIVTYIIRRMQLIALIHIMTETWWLNLVSSVHGWLITEQTRFEVVTVVTMKVSIL